MNDRPNRRSRAIIAGLLMLPAFGAVADLALRSARHSDHAARYVTKAHVRAAVDPLEERQLPIEQAIAAAFDRTGSASSRFGLASDQGISRDDLLRPNDLHGSGEWELMDYATTLVLHLHAEVEVDAPFDCVTGDKFARDAKRPLHDLLGWQFESFRVQKGFLPVAQVEKETGHGLTSA